MSEKLSSIFIKTTLLLTIITWVNSCKSEPKVTHKLKPNATAIKQLADTESMLATIPKQPIDSATLVNDLLTEIDHLLVSKDSLLINPQIFGDCIYSQLDIEEPQSIRRSDIMRNFNRIFDRKFRNKIRELKNKQNIEYEYLIHDGSFQSLGNCQYVATIDVTITPDAFSRIYWFCFDGQNWIFRGISGVG